MMTCGILKFCIRDMLGSFQRKTIFELCNVLTELFAEDIIMSDIEKLEYRTHRVLALLERDFPVSLNVIVFHLLHHLPMFLRRFGPVCNYWMYPFERFISWMSRRALNRRYPESTIIETYRLFELSAFMSLAKLLPEKSVGDITTVFDDRVEVKQGDCLTKEMSLALIQFYESQGDNLDISNAITSQSFLTTQDKHGRTVRYSTYTSLSVHSSCIVYKHLNSRIILILMK